MPDDRRIPPPPPRPEPQLGRATGRSADGVPLTELLATSAVERVTPNPTGARTRIRDAAAHLRTAGMNLDDDPRGAVSLAHAAARKAITAQMLIEGYRPTGEGGHLHVVQYAIAQLGDVVDRRDLETLERLRRDRIQAEYLDGAEIITAKHARLAVELAERVVSALTEWFREHHPDLVRPS